MSADKKYSNKKLWMVVAVISAPIAALGVAVPAAAPMLVKGTIVGGILAGLVMGLSELPAVQQLIGRIRQYFASADSPASIRVNEQPPLSRLVEKKNL